MKRFTVVAIVLLAFSARLTCRAAPTHSTYVPLVIAPGGSGSMASPDLGTAPDADSEPPTEPTPEPPLDDEALAIQELVTLVNEHRAAQGLPNLQLAPELADAARRHVNDMAQHGNLCHIGSDGSTPGQRIRAARYEWLDCAEVIALGPGDPQAIVDVWLASDSHREILLAPGLTDLGVSRVRAPDGAYYWTADLGARLQR